MVRVLRAVGLLVVLLVVGIVVVAATGGRFYVGGGVTGCAVGQEVQDAAGPIPGVVRGGYAASILVQVGDMVFEPGVTVWVRSDTVAVALASCRGAG